jgi:uncharacterized protein YndB with AHSA1/START domain
MPTTPPGTDVVEHEVRVAARPEIVFAYFTDPARMVQWMGAEATLDPRPGGVCRIAFQPPPSLAGILDATFGPEQERALERLWPNAPRVMMGEFVEVVPHSRIALTWGWEEELYTMPPQSTAVEVSLTPDGESTIVHLTHRRLPSTAVPLHTGGWQHYLSRLAIVAAGGDPGSDPWEAGAVTP